MSNLSIDGSSRRYLRAVLAALLARRLARRRLAPPGCKRQAGDPRDADRRRARQRLRRSICRRAQPLFAAGARTPPSPPASVEKLYTTSTALLRFGAGRHASHTADASRPARTTRTGVWRGDLYLARRRRPDARPRCGSARSRSRSPPGPGMTRIARRRHRRRDRLRRLRGSSRTGGAADGDLGGALGGAHGRPRLQRRDAAGPGGAARRLAMRPLAAAGDGRVGAGGRGHRRRAEGASSVAGTTSPPMRDLIRLTNTPSDNFYAEMLLKVLGARFGAAGTTHAGVGGRARPARAPSASTRGGRRLGALAGRPHHAAPGRAPARAHGRQAVAGDLQGLAAGGRPHRDAAPPDARHGGGGALPGQDRDAERRQRARRLLPQPDGHTSRSRFLMSNVNIFTAHGVQDRGTVAIAGLTAR